MTVQFVASNARMTKDILTKLRGDDFVLKETGYDLAILDPPALVSQYSFHDDHRFRNDGPISGDFHTT
jgi:hypothetical protein